MLIKNINMLVTNTAMRELPDRTIYCSVGLLSMDDGQKYDVSVKEKEIYEKLKPMTNVNLDLELLNSKYGMKLNIKNLVNVGKSIVQA